MLAAVQVSRNRQRHADIPAESKPMIKSNPNKKQQQKLPNS
jgi:hypothetical protein